MRRRRGRGFLGIALLALLCGGLAVIIIFEMEARFADRPARTAARREHKAVDSPAGEPRFVMPAFRALDGVLARPVFSESRRPAPPDAAATSASSAPFALVGVVLSASERHALLEHGQPVRIDRAVEGQELDGWTLETIQLDRVILRHGETRVEVKAKDKAGASVALQRRGAAPPPAARAAQLPPGPGVFPLPLGEPAQQ